MYACTVRKDLYFILFFFAYGIILMILLSYVIGSQQLGTHTGIELYDSPTHTTRGHVTDDGVIRTSNVRKFSHRQSLQHPTGSPSPGRLASDSRRTNDGQPTKITC